MAYTDSDIRDAIKRTEHAGGEKYGGKIDPDTADTTVSTLSQLQSALDGSANVIAIDSNIYVGEAELDITDKTLVGDRGWDGSNGPLLWTDARGYTDGGVGSNRPYAMFYSYATGETPRISGLRIRGARYDEDFTRWDYDTNLAAAITIRGDGVEVDNCEIWGWTWADVMLRGYSPSDRVSYGDIHHNHLHQSYQLGYGYGVNHWHGESDVRYNYFNEQRHSITARGWYFTDMLVEENIFGPTYRTYAVDCHAITEDTSNHSGDDPSATDYGLRAGGAIDVRNNTFCYSENDTGGNNNAVVNRGVPWEHVNIHNCRFTHPTEPTYNSGNSQDGTAYRQINVHGVTDNDGITYDPVAPDGEFTTEWSTYDNQFDAENTEWTSEYGASIDLQSESQLYDLTIIVSNEDSELVSNADVTIAGLTQTTGTSGEVTFSLEPNEYSVSVQHPDYLDASETVTLGQSDTSETITLQSGDSAGTGSSGFVCRTEATVDPTTESLSLTIQEDVGNTGVINDSVTVTVPDGSAEHDLDTLDGSVGNRYVPSLSFSADTVEASPQLHSLELESQAQEGIAAMYGRVGDTLVEIPLFDPETVDNPIMQARPPGHDILAFDLIDASESSLQCRTPSGEIYGVYSTTDE